MEIYKQFTRQANQTNSSEELNIGENILNNPQEIAECFNEYFSNIGPDLASKIDMPNCNFETYVKKSKSEFTAYSNLKLLMISLTYCVDYQAIKQLELIRFHAKLLR